MNHHDGASSVHMFVFDGGAIPFTPGQSVAAALLAHGVQAWRTTRVEHSPRAIFCGIGVCYDCLVIAGGVRGVRACLLQAKDGLQVEPMPLPAEAPILDGTTTGEVSQ